MDFVTHVFVALLVVLFFQSRHKKHLPRLLLASGILTLSLYLLEGYFASTVYLQSLLVLLLLSFSLSKLQHASMQRLYFDTFVLTMLTFSLLHILSIQGSPLLFPLVGTLTLGWLAYTDPYVLFLSGIGIVLFLLLKRHAILRIALIALILHISYMGYFHHVALERNSSAIEALPVYASPLHWTLVLENQTTFSFYTQHILEGTNSSITTRKKPQEMDTYSPYFFHLLHRSST